jgi:nicotinate-nucleotide adenylyltransferase
MTRLAVLKNRSFDVLDIECARSGKSYTVRTIEALRKIHKDSELFFLLGIDTFLDIKNWWKPEKLLSLINFAVLSRPGNWFIDLLTSPYLELKKSLLSRLDRGETETFSSELRSGKKLVLLRITPVAISSTEIRKRIKEGLTIKYMLPEEVESYIIFNKLYRME